jgi:hypothetical protein
MELHTAEYAIAIPPYELVSRASGRVIIMKQERSDISSFAQFIYI